MCLLAEDIFLPFAYVYKYIFLSRYISIHRMFIYSIQIYLYPSPVYIFLSRYICIHRLYIYPSLIYIYISIACIYIYILLSRYICIHRLYIYSYPSLIYIYIYIHRLYIFYPDIFVSIALLYILPVSTRLIYIYPSPFILFGFLVALLNDGRGWLLERKKKNAFSLLFYWIAIRESFI